jgi:hypothetical protein
MGSGSYIRLAVLSVVPNEMNISETQESRRLRNQQSCKDSDRSLIPDHEQTVERADSLLGYVEHKKGELKPKENNNRI